MKFLFPILLIFLSIPVKADVDFRVPSRDYINEKGAWNIYYEADMKSADPELAKDALKKLKSTLKKN
ncbi:hypothetical protein [Thalassotalea ganghwensis]